MGTVRFLPVFISQATICCILVSHPGLLLKLMQAGGPFHYAIICRISPLLPVKFILEALSIYIVRVYVLYSCNFLKNSTKSVSVTESMFSY